MPATGQFLEKPEGPKLGHVVEAKKTGKVIAEFDIDTVQFKIYGSQVLTVEKAERILFDRQQLVRCYHFLTDDHRLDLPLNACRGVVLGEIIRIWYEVSGFEVPQKVTQAQEERMAKAKETTAQAEQAAADAGTTATKEPRITNRSIIENGLLAGQSNEEIMKAVKARFPDGKADDKHIGYYRHFLVKAGKLEKQPRQPRAKKATAEGSETAAEAPATKVAAKAGSAKAAPAAEAAPAKTAGGAQPKPGRESKSTAKSK